jgi:hypothetical protein
MITLPYIQLVLFVKLIRRSHAKIYRERRFLPERKRFLGKIDHWIGAYVSPIYP